MNTLKLTNSNNNKLRVQSELKPFLQNTYKNIWISNLDLRHTKQGKFNNEEAMTQKEMC